MRSVCMYVRWYVWQSRLWGDTCDPHGFAMVAYMELVSAQRTETHAELLQRAEVVGCFLAGYRGQSETTRRCCASLSVRTGVAGTSPRGGAVHGNIFSWCLVFRRERGGGWMRLKP